jgi:hypothetical protein
MFGMDSPPIGFVRSKTSKGACHPVPNPHAAKIRALANENAELRDLVGDLAQRLEALESQTTRPSRSKKIV